MFDRELSYFIENQDELVEKFRGKVLVLQGESILGVYTTPLEALLQTEKAHPLGSFMLQPCEPGPDAFTVTVSTVDLLEHL